MKKSASSLQVQIDCALINLRAAIDMSVGVDHPAVKRIARQIRVGIDRLEDRWPM